ncbi:MAG TPA: hypothetical protein VGR57_01260 [Ktedonobacterales bacterium]|nr:hypothetical protein [Ktedonobacterales bacterium]
MGRPNAFDGMMHKFCVGLGYCGSVNDGKPQHVTDFIPETGPVSAEQFARWLLAAESGYDAEVFDPSDVRIRQFSAIFIKHMGADVVDASLLHSEWGGA